MEKSIEEIDKQLSKQYGIKRPTFNEDDLKEVRTLLDEKLRQNPEWQKIWVTETTMIRFLKAFIHVRETVHALEEYCKWRLEEDIDGIAASDMEADDDMKKERAKERDRILDGCFDRCGRPILLVTVRNHDKHHNNYPVLFRYSVYCLENLIQIAEQETFDRRICLIFDLGGFSTANMDFKFVRQTLHFLRDFIRNALELVLSLIIHGSFGDFGR